MGTTEKRTEEQTFHPVRIELGSIDVPPLHVHPGRYLTIYMHGACNTPTQIELHVTRDGELRVLTDRPDLVEYKEFKDIYGLPVDPK